MNPIELEQAFNDPVLKSTLPQKGDITALEFLNSGTAAFASGLGSVHLVNVSKSSITVQHSWEKLHYYKTGEPCVCSDISCLDEDVASVGEDGRIVLLTANEPQPVRVIGNCMALPTSYTPNQRKLKQNFGICEKKGSSWLFPAEKKLFVAFCRNIGKAYCVWRLLPL